MGMLDTEKGVTKGVGVAQAIVGLLVRTTCHRCWLRGRRTSLGTQGEVAVFCPLAPTLAGRELGGGGGGYPARVASSTRCDNGEGR